MTWAFGTGYGINHTGPANSVLYVACNQNVGAPQIWGTGYGKLPGSDSQLMSDSFCINFILINFIVVVVHNSKFLNKIDPVSILYSGNFFFWIVAFFTIRCTFKEPRNLFQRIDSWRTGTFKELRNRFQGIVSGLPVRRIGLSYRPARLH